MPRHFIVCLEGSRGDQAEADGYAVAEVAADVWCKDAHPGSTRKGDVLKSPATEGMGWLCSVGSMQWVKHEAVRTGAQTGGGGA